jgi:hypothetical protein
MRKSDYSDLPPSAFEYLNWIEHDLGLAIVLKGHLFIEHLLALAIWKALPQQGESDFVFELRFPVKVDLAASLGLIRPEDRRAYLTLNSIRNRFAHEPRAYFSSEDAKRLYGALPEDLKERLAQVGRTPEGCDTDTDFCKICTALLMDHLTQALGDGHDPASKPVA